MSLSSDLLPVKEEIEPLSPVTHFLVGWLTANTSQAINRKSRILVTVSAIIPDVDGFGQVLWLVTQDWAIYDRWYVGYHHKLTHNFLTALLLMGVIYWFANSARWTTALLAGISFHLHLIGDLLGSRGSDALTRVGF
ncbi:MAG: metal-dependent hydrolase [Magnetococcus sp. YQC-5]